MYLFEPVSEIALRLDVSWHTVVYELRPGCLAGPLLPGQPQLHRRLASISES